MKKQIITIALLISSLVSFSNTEIKNNFTDKTKKVTVEFKNVKKGHSLTIKDKNGSELYSETISENGNLSKILDVTSLDEGNYVIEMDKDYEIVIKRFQVSPNQVILLSDEEKIIFKPVIRNQENIVMVSKIEFDAEPTQIAIYFENEVIFSETVKAETILNRVYKLDSEKKGAYTVVVYNQDRKYRNSFKI
ncbi:hypothetical protein IU405_15410 [Polaribacter sp. BAL334]|jgi:hypothetical protein|uniref:hypothetical protein n=1 Tax=Polaribacter sp. BAL334 TaxID=1708178 RepID=UPI0018D268E3|nr:hypothetical protein [Polaribacter sp. BAL334]MBG7613642.1 hypothetical protein [Polaribacter sp. BAL334]